MPAVDQLATSLETLRLRLARTPLPRWGRSMADAALSHPFWKFSGGTQMTQLLQFMKNMGLVGGLVLLSGAGGAKRR